MKPATNQEETLFREALKQPAGLAREGFLDGACLGQDALRQRIAALLQAFGNAESFLEPDTAAAAGGTMRISVPEEVAGTRIGHYKLLQKIGVGGCGIVYMAEQEEPVRRRVALKIIKLGMDTRQVIARFEAERQALALMDHPNIAKVFDAGATDLGRPFFVMELVKGIPITSYCDENKLSTEERLHLFIQVCHAIQHAHQKGIIHRDIKPSNILVADHDGTPVSKVIDFGIAKATTDQRLTDKTLFTAFEQFVGTPAYMSPEQARLSGLDIDTRSDIYSLGVLLYELLSSKTPFESKRLLDAGLDEIRRIIREEEPMRPSTRLHALNADEQTTVAKHRKTDPPKLISLIHGDLDWIVMKALEKDRTRRYETATGLATDIQRHLSNEPVMARPPSNVYRFQKTVQRHKLAVAAAAAVVAALAAGMGVSTWLFLKERQAHRNEVAAIEAQLREQQLARHLQERAEQEARLRQLTALAQQHTAQNQWAEAEPLLREKLALQDKLLGKESLDTADSLIELGAALLAQRKWAESESTLRTGIAMEKKFLKKGDPNLITPYLMLREMLEDKGRTSELETIDREMAAEAPKPGSSEFTNQLRMAAAARTFEFMSAMQDAGLMPTTSQSQAYLQASALANQKEYNKAEQVFSNVLTPEFSKKRQSTTMLYGRAEFYARRGRWKEAAGDYSRLIGFDPSSNPLLYHSLGALLAQNGDLEGYRRICGRVLDLPGVTNNPVVAERTAKLCLSLPDAGVDLETVARMAKNLVAEGENQKYLPFFEFVKGLASYRQGHFAGAIKVMQKLVASDENYVSAQAYLVLAMAQHQTGLDKEARSALAKGSDIVENELPKLTDGDLGQNWMSWIFAHRFLNEARSLMDTPPKTQSPKE